MLEIVLTPKILETVEIEVPRLSLFSLIVNPRLPATSIWGKILDLKRGLAYNNFAALKSTDMTLSNNGVRQRGVLSPYLFAVYLDKLSDHLSSAKVKYTTGNMVVNHLMFADDICVFSPSISGLQCLLNICGDYAAEHEITFNCNKTIGVPFCPKKYKQPAPSNVFLNGVRVEFLTQ